MLNQQPSSKFIKLLQRDLYQDDYDDRWDPDSDVYIYPEVEEWISSAKKGDEYDNVSDCKDWYWVQLLVVANQLERLKDLMIEFYDDVKKGKHQIQPFGAIGYTTWEPAITSHFFLTCLETLCASEDWNLQCRECIDKLLYEIESQGFMRGHCYGAEMLLEVCTLNMENFSWDQGIYMLTEDDDIPTCDMHRQLCHHGSRLPTEWWATPINWWKDY